MNKLYEGGSDYIGTPGFETVAAAYTIPDSCWRFNINGTSGVDFDIDNLAIYKAANKTLTYHNPDGSVMKTESAQVLSTATPGASSYSYMLVGGKMNRVTGWSLTKGGEAVTSFTVEDDTDLYPAFAETTDGGEYGTLVFYNDLENNEIGDDVVYGGWYNGIAKNAVFRYTNNSNTFGVDYENGESGNKVMKVVRTGGGYAGIMMMSMTAVGGGQTYFPNGKGVFTYMFRFNSPGPSAFAAAGAWNAAFVNGNNVARGSYAPTSADLAAGWKDVAFSDDGSGAAFTRINFFHNYMYANTMLFDDIRLFYRPAVTFHKPDDTTETVVTDKGCYEVPAIGATPVIKYEDGKLYSQIGWSLTDGGEAVTVVDNLGKDFDLYPVWNVADTVLDKTVMSAVSGKTLSAVSSVPFTAATVKNDGYTGAAVTFDTAASTINVTAAGYAGEITVTLTTAYGNIDVVISLLGGTNWKPGLNVYTGTTEPLDFEDLVDLDLGNWQSDTDPIGDRGAVLRATTAWNGANVRVLSNPIEKERPMRYSLDRLSDIYTSLFINVQDSANQYKQLGAGPAGEWVSYSFMFDYTSGKCGDMRNTIASFTHVRLSPFNGTFKKYADDTDDTVYTYIDNLSLIPSYKITYVDNADGTTVLKTVYALTDDSGALLTEYTPYIDDLEGAVGVSLEKNGTNVTSVALKHEDITLYVKSDANAPIIYNECQIRTSSTNGGLRFGAFISASQRADADEYGFIVSLAKSFEDGDYSALMFPADYASATADGETKSGTTASGAKFVCGSSYVKATGVDHYSIAERNDEDGFRFNAVMVGLSGRDQFMTKLVARPYIVIDGTVCYGAARAQDIYTVAKALYDAGDTSEYVASIVSACAE